MAWEFVATPSQFFHGVTDPHGPHPVDEEAVSDRGTIEWTQATRYS